MVPALERIHETPTRAGNEAQDRIILDFAFSSFSNNVCRRPQAGRIDQIVPCRSPSATSTTRTTYISCTVLLPQLIIEYKKGSNNCLVSAHFGGVIRDE